MLRRQRLGGGQARHELRAVRVQRDGAGRIAAVVEQGEEVRLADALEAVAAEGGGEVPLRCKAYRHDGAEVQRDALPAQRCLVPREGVLEGVCRGVVGLASASRQAGYGR